MTKRLIYGASAAGSGAAMPVVVSGPVRKKRIWTPGPTPDQTSKTLTPAIMEIEMTTAKKPDFEKITADSTAFGKDQLEAYTKAATVFSKGTEELIKTYVTLTQESAEKSAAGLKALMGCKTLTELTETQNKLAQEGMEGFISNMTKISELSAKIATDSFAPINTQVTKAMKKASESVAA